MKVWGVFLIVLLPACASFQDISEEQYINEIVWLVNELCNCQEAFDNCQTQKTWAEETIDDLIFDTGIPSQETHFDFLPPGIDDQLVIADLHNHLEQCRKELTELKQRNRQLETINLMWLGTYKRGIPSQETDMEEINRQLQQIERLQRQQQEYEELKWMMDNLEYFEGRRALPPPPPTW